MTTSCGDQVVQDGILGYEKSPEMISSWACPMCLGDPNCQVSPSFRKSDIL